MTRVTPPLASQWAGDSAWLAMDTSARGFHAQLMLFAAQRDPAGTLPDDDALWRRVAGVPEAGGTDEEVGGPVDPAAAALMRQSLQVGQQMGVPDALVLALHPQARSWRENQGNWLDHLWITRWKPMLLAAWPVITEAVVARLPHLAGQQGARYCELAVRLGHGEALVPAAREAGAPQVAPPASAIPPPPKPTTRRGKAGKETDPMFVELLAITPMTDAFHDTDYVLGCFRALPLVVQGQGVWDLGLRALAPTNTSEATQRSYLAKLIKEFGESAVAAALAEVLVKPQAPAEIKSFIQGVLRSKRDGSVAVQAAREQRARIQL